MEKQLSKRSQRRLRVQLAKRLVDEGECDPRRCSKKLRLEDSEQPTTDDDSRDPEQSWEGEPSGAESCSNDESDGHTHDSESDAEQAESSGASGDSFEGNRLRDEEAGDMTSEFSGELGDSDGELGSEDMGYSLSDSESVNSEQNINEEPLDTGIPLFPQSHISSVDFNIAFMSLVQRHNLTYSSQTDILRLVSMVLPTPNTVPSSSGVLITKFANFNREAIVQHYCGSCTSIIDTGSSCTRPLCSRVQERHAVFIRIPLTAQLTERFQGTFESYVKYITVKGYTWGTPMPNSCTFAFQIQIQILLTSFSIAFTVRKDLGSWQISTMEVPT